MSLIGLMCKRGDTFSLQVLIGRGLFLLLLLTSSPSALRFISSFKEVGVYCAEVTPVPIPNTEVKLCREDNTWLATAWENISMPALYKRKSDWLPFNIIGPLAQLVRASGS